MIIEFTLSGKHSQYSLLPSYVTLKPSRKYLTCSLKYTHLKHETVIMNGEYEPVVFVSMQ